ncbi:MAG: ribosome recycling factor [Chloroflexi bacterium]|nr:ribosome recycling factor [Chloroflexota bacterium]
MTDKLLSESESKMKKAVEALKRNLATIRTGRASPGLIEGLMVDYFGTSMPLNQLANISVPEARLLAIQPWDKQAISLVEKAILQANLGLNPSNDGTLIRIPIPPLTDERRQELVKMVQKRVEEGRVSIRNARRDSMDQTRSLKKNKEISEDQERRTEERLQKLTDDYVRRINDAGAAKEKDLIET